MTSSDFQAKVAKRFPKIAPTTLAEIGEEIKCYSEGDIYTIWDQFNTFNTNLSAPHWGVFQNIAYKLDLRRVSGGGRELAKHYMTACYAPILDAHGAPVFDRGDQLFCLSTYSTQDEKCPRCGNRHFCYQSIVSVDFRPGIEEAKIRFAFYGQNPHPLSAEGLKQQKERPMQNVAGRVRRYAVTMEELEEIKVRGVDAEAQNRRDPYVE